MPSSTWSSIYSTMLSFLISLLQQHSWQEMVWLSQLSVFESSPRLSSVRFCVARSIAAFYIHRIVSISSYLEICHIEGCINRKIVGSLFLRLSWSISSLFGAREFDVWHGYNCFHIWGRIRVVNQELARSKPHKCLSVVVAQVETVPILHTQYRYRSVCISSPASNAQAAPSKLYGHQWFQVHGLKQTSRQVSMSWPCPDGHSMSIPTISQSAYAILYIYQSSQPQRDSCSICFPACMTTYFLCREIVIFRGVLIKLNSHEQRCFMHAQLAWFSIVRL